MPVAQTVQLAVLLGVVLGGCEPPHAAPAPVETERRAAPSELVVVDDATLSCSDVGSIRVCWGRPERVEPGCGDWACLVEPRVPDAPSDMGWRCTGAGVDRRCAPRSHGASPFARVGAEHVQAHPRLPDAGEWACTDEGGAVVCAGGARAAGIPPSAGDPGWFCGKRGGEGHEHERVCVDFSPDLPTDDPGPFKCRFDGPEQRQRVCVRDRDAHLLGDTCDAAHPCLDGARCLGGRCVPREPEPRCLVDTDCDEGRCRFGSCLSEGS